LSAVSFAHAQTIDPQWKVNYTPQPMMLGAPAPHISISQDATDASATQLTGTDDKGYQVAVSMQPPSYSGHKPGFSVGPCITSVDLLLDIATSHSYTLGTLLDIGFCASYTIALR
jgi:hypothetical protein